MKQGALIFDEQADRYDIRFDLADYYGGLHCGETFDVMVGGKWRPTRIEMAEDWYLVGIRADDLACVLPDVLTSPQLTAEWENTLTAIAKGEADPEGFMAGIEEMTRGLISGYSQISEDAQKLFQAERVVIGKCPRCGEAVYEGKKNYYCGNRACQFVMWKNDRFFEERGKAFTPKIAAALLKDGKAKVKGLRSMKTGKTYDGTVLLADTGGKYVNYRIERRDKN